MPQWHNDDDIPVGAACIPTYLYTVQVSSLIPVGRMPNDTMTTSNDSDLVRICRLGQLG